jgi:hypothetical protein
VVAAAAITLRHHAAEALLEVDMLQGDMPGVDMPGVAMVGPGWGRLELAGTVLTGPVRGTAAIGTVAAIGTAPTRRAVIGAAATTGMAIIGVATTGMATGEIRTADGVGGTVTGGVLPETMSCLLAALAFHGGGAGAGALGAAAGVAAGAAAGVVTVIMATVILTMVADPAIPITAMATDTAPSTSLRTVNLSTVSLSTVSMETAANPESPSCNDGCHGLAITMDPSMESLGRRLVAQSGITSKHTAT